MPPKVVWYAPAVVGKYVTPPPAAEAHNMGNRDRPGRNVFIADVNTLDILHRDELHAVSFRQVVNANDIFLSTTPQPYGWKLSSGNEVPLPSTFP